MKHLYIDVETTGINPSEHAVIQLAALLARSDGSILDKIVLNIAPDIKASIDPEALDVTGKTLEEIKSYPTAQEQLGKFTDFLQQYVSPYDKKDKFLFLAYNAPFDVEFVRNFFLRQGNKFFGSYFWHPPIDIMILAMQALKDRRSDMSNFKLATVAKELGVSVSDSHLHDAYYDILLTYEVYQRLFPPAQHNVPAPESSLPATETEVYKDTLF